MGEGAVMKRRKKAPARRKRTIAQEAKRRRVSQNRVRRDRRAARIRAKEREGVRKYGSVKAWNAAMWAEFQESIRGTPFDTTTHRPRARTASRPSKTKHRHTGSASVLDRIRKLLRLAGSPNKHEAQLARQRAEELMAKHGITVEDL